jgi:UDP-GlcNAc:undecaprenyl-phosphate GlcNAc-1-phosphate transferase
MSHLPSSLLIWASSTFAAAWFGTGIVRHFARRLGLLANPRADRWHQQPVALHGGVGFYPAFAVIGSILLTCTAAVACPAGGGSRLPPQLGLGAALLAGSSIMFMVGLWDDVSNLRPLTKLVGQFIAATLFIVAGGTFSLSDNALFNQLLTYFWFLGITNAVNMLDNMDGLASGVVIISSLALAALTWQAGASAYLGLSFAVMLAAALAGFLLYNRAPASIFMGDSGSLSIGYLAAGLAVPSQLNGYFGPMPTDNIFGHLVSLLVPALALSIPIFDTTLVTVTRKWRAQPVSQGGCDHLSHRLVRLGLHESTAVHVLYLLAVVGCILAILLQRFPRQTSPWLLLFVAVLIGSGLYLGRVKVVDAYQPRLPE